MDITVIRMKDVDVLTGQWRASNTQRRPSGTGLWRFAVGDREVTSYGLYSEAVRVAKRAAAREGARVIELLP